jgi:hypothetical protein
MKNNKQFTGIQLFKYLIIFIFRQNFVANFISHRGNAAQTGMDVFKIELPVNLFIPLRTSTGILYNLLRIKHYKIISC